MVAIASDHSSSGFLSKANPACPEALLKSCRDSVGDGLRLAIVGADSLPAIETAMMTVREGIATPHLIGNPDKIKNLAQTLNWDLRGIEISAANDEESLIMTACRLVREGQADAVMKGQIHTDRFMGGLLSREGGVRGEGRMIHVFAMFPVGGGKPLLISDAAVNVAPDETTSREALFALKHVAQALGVAKPKIAIISATESPIPSVPSSLAAEKLAVWGKANIKDVEISGPLSFDLALSPPAAEIKGISGDSVAGYADALLMPDITSGNVLFKAMVWFCGACAAGVVLGGQVPIMLTSRSDSAAARLASVALAAKLSSSDSQKERRC